MKLLLFLTTILLYTSLNAQVCETYIIKQQVGTSDYDFGTLNETNGNIVLDTTILSNAFDSDFDEANSCIDNQNGIIYFFESGEEEIISLDVNTGSLTRTTTTASGYLEYSDSTNKLYVINYSFANYNISELNPLTGTVSNTVTATIPIGGGVKGKTTLNQQSGEVYLIEKPGAGYDLTRMNLFTGNVSAVSITNVPAGGEIWFVEHHNLTGNTYVILTDSSSSWHIAQINTTTGVLSNINSFTINTANPIFTDYMTYMDELNGIFYFRLIFGEIVGVNVASSVATTVASSGGIDIIERRNINCTVTNVPKHEFKTDLSLYPNPINGKFYVDLGDNYPQVNVTITDLLGKVVHTAHYNNTHLLNLQLSAPAAVYFLTLESEDKRAVMKFVKE